MHQRVTFGTRYVQLTKHRNQSISILLVNSDASESRIPRSRTTRKPTFDLFVIYEAYETTTKIPM